MGDALRLRQILVNLVSNAIKFSGGREHAGRVSVRLLSAGVERGHARLVLQVQDNGIGIDEETRSRLFTPFSQADTSTTRRFGGSGLGLAITRHLVELMAGRIEVDSAPGVGSVFRVHLALPLAPDARPAPTTLSGVGCVVIGDAGSAAADLVLVLAAAGARVECVAEPARARAAMGEEPTGPWVWIADAGGDRVDVDALVAAARLGEPSVRVVAIGRGALREPRLDAAGTVHVDANVLTRRKLVQAVALAIGRATTAPETTTGRHRTEFEPPARDAAARAGRLVLVAEDNETNQQVIVRQLGLLGFAADVARDGRAAFDLWKSGDYALVLSDLHMPVMDGFELTRAIRAAEAGGERRIPIVALTANTLKGEAERCRTAGMDDYLSKPLQLAHLRALLEACVPGSTQPLLPRPADRRDDTGALDVGVLRELVGDDPAILRGFLQRFRDSAARTVRDVEAAAAAGSAADVVAQAHKLKSAARTVGALALGELCERIEAAGKTGDAAEIARLLPVFGAEMKAVERCLDTAPVMRKGESHG
jgi:CheY-like chemotaxis protein/HPt (histidine-containing phosphotransfer) domain-containing protein